MSILHALTPSKLRLILSITLMLIVLAGGGLFYLAYNRLGQSASETGEQAAAARESQDNLQRLQTLRKELEAKKEVIAMTSQIMANNENYAYQDRLVNDLTIYASRANLTISNISFSAAQASQAQSGAGTDTTALSTSGLQKTTVDITLTTPIKYQDLLNFLHYVESNLTKLKVSRVSMTKGEADGVSVDVLNLEVYVR